jgi:CRISPR/Cas system CMR-associated protein Cmr5 small subunit
MMGNTSPDGGSVLKPRSIERGQSVLESGLDWDKLSDTQVGFLKGLPTMIMQNGLGQTIALLGSKKENDILKALTRLFLADESKSLITFIVNECDISRYLYLQKEAIEYAGWMKKFAVAAHPDRNTREDAP